MVTIIGLILNLHILSEDLNTNGHHSAGLESNLDITEIHSIGLITNRYSGSCRPKAFRSVCVRTITFKLDSWHAGSL